METKITVVITKGFLATFILLGVYFTIVALVSGWSFAESQFRQFWYYVVTLAAGFGIQVGLYSYLKTAVKGGVDSRVVATTGATSTAAMLSWPGTTAKT